MTSNFHIEEKIVREIRARQIALAYLERGREAGIPENYLRVSQQEFEKLLCPKFHQGKNEISSLSNLIYNNSIGLRKKKFILIDGADIETRKKAGCAILFRIICCDSRGLYIGFSNLFHKFQTINATDDITRNDLSEETKRYDVLFLNDYHAPSLSPHFESANFIDEVLSARSDRGKPTIISFAIPIEDAKKSKEELAASGSFNNNGGRYMSQLSFAYKTTDTILRIRVTSNES